MERKSAMRRRNSAPKSNASQQMENENTNQDNSQASNSEIIQLLQKVNEQLSKIDQSSNNQNNTQGSSNPNSANPLNNSDSNNTQSNNSETDNNKQKTSITSELEKLFKKALTGKQTQSSANNNQNQQAEQEKSSKQITGIAAQTAVQVLAQTQYELANELEVSLKKLKQVISESEQVAQKIANLLGEESGQ